ncbi:S1 RNA-binding domain-containing protein [Candidatus Peregrinibacteria bacterium]|nr:S1 RNA-binding domain-containing protein [Candidatus Peregrinibacteria bacterium]
MSTTQSMDEIIQNMDDIKLPQPGTLIDGKVVAKHQNKLLIDLDGVTTGIISGREAKDAEDTAKNAKVGDEISAYVIDPENDEGYTVLSLRKAGQERTWKRFIDAYENENSVTVKANEANKGGLLLDVNGIKGFIPVSQLAPMHYPRVNDADANQILQRLQALVGIEFKVKIINIDKENGKLILSERAAMEEQRQEALEGLDIGTEVEGEVSRITPFGVFVKLNDEINGLIHVTELSGDGEVKDAGEILKIGDKIKAKVIAVEPEEHRVGLSIKALTEEISEAPEEEEENKADKESESNEEEKAVTEEKPKKSVKKKVVKKKSTTKKNDDDVKNDDHDDA